MLGIIGGSGLTKLPDLAMTGTRDVRTPYGDPSSALVCGQIAGRDVVFLARHGGAHTIPPHRINYRANLWAMREAGVREIVAVFSVGGIARGLGPGAIVIPDQLIDYTWGRDHTYFDGRDTDVVHIDFTRPYSQRVRLALLEAAEQAGIPATVAGVYGAVNGPRLETAAEIDKLDRDGVTIVGMTGMPEAALARELDLAYAALAVSVNHAAGREDSADSISLEQIQSALEPAMLRVRKILHSWIQNHD